MSKERRRNQRSMVFTYVSWESGGDGEIQSVCSLPFLFYLSNRPPSKIIFAKNHGCLCYSLYVHAVLTTVRAKC